QRIAEAFSCRTRTVEKLRQRLVECGFREALDGAKRELPPVEKLLCGEQEARIIATRLGSPPSGYANWTLRLLARKVVELGIVESVSYETVRRTLEKTVLPTASWSPGSARPRPPASAWPTWKRCWRPTRGRTTRWGRSCAWTNSRCNC